MSDLYLPTDPPAERQAIGAVLIQTETQATRAFRTITGKMFSDDYHGWLWDRLRWGCKVGRWNDIADWLHEERHLRRGVVYDLAVMMRLAWGNNIHFYTTRVRRLYERRLAVLDAAETLRRVQAAARRER